MFTSPEKKPSVVNWFSSLRRVPKNKKNAATVTTNKTLQKSCVDLSTNNTNIMTVDDHKSKEIPAVNGIINIGQLAALVTECPATISKTNTIEIDQVRRISKSQHGSPNRQISNNSADGIVSTTIDGKAIKITTTTKVTHTTVVTKQIHRVGLVFNDNGELISNLESFRNFANQLNSKLVSLSSSNNNNDHNHLDNDDDDDNDDVDDDDDGDTSKLSFLDDDIEYIDGTSTSQSDISSNKRDRERSDGDKKRQQNQCVTCQNKGKSNSEWNLSTKKQIKDELCEVVAEMEALDSQEDCKHSNKDKQMSIGRKKFNMDPKKGIEYLCENHLLRMDAQDIAHFLYKGEGLNKTAIGDYLGEKNDFNEQVLKAFVELHDFTNLILVQALRQFLWSFRLPGEAQKIDRMMECFAQRYCQLNPDIFTNTDTCYVLSFAIIMLNTSLHNPSVKDKPALEQFISMNRGINNGGDLPRELLESLYESIRTEPFKIPQDDGNDLMHTFFNPDKEGWLWKQGGRYKSWKRRWFILNDNCLYYFEYTTDKEPRGIIPLENISVREIQDRNKPHCFELYACGGADIIKACKTDSEGKVVEGKHTVYRMSAATEEDKLEWIKCLTQSISHNPFYDILVQRKKKALAKS